MTESKNCSITKKRPSRGRVWLVREEDVDKCSDEILLRFQGGALSACGATTLTFEEESILLQQLAKEHDLLSRVYFDGMDRVCFENIVAKIVAIECTNTQLQKTYNRNWQEELWIQCDSIWEGILQEAAEAVHVGLKNIERNDLLWEI